MGIELPSSLGARFQAGLHCRYRGGCMGRRGRARGTWMILSDMIRRSEPGGGSFDWGGAASLSP